MLEGKQIKILDLDYQIDQKNQCIWLKNSQKRLKSLFSTAKKQKIKVMGENLKKREFLKLIFILDTMIRSDSFESMVIRFITFI